MAKYRKRNCQDKYINKVIEEFLIPDFNEDSPQYFRIGDVWDERRACIFIQRRGSAYYLDVNEEHPRILPLAHYFSGKDYGLPKLDERISRIYIDNEGQLVLTSQEKIYWIDLDSGANKHLKENSFNKQVFSRHHTNSVLQDNNGNIWWGTYGGGIAIGWQRTNLLEFYEHDPLDSSSVSPGQIRSFTKDINGNIWVGTLNSGLDRFVFRKDGRLEKTTSIHSLTGKTNELKESQIIQLINDKKGNIWVATSMKGIIKFDPAEFRSKRFSYDPESQEQYRLSENRIWGLEVDSANGIWVGTWSGGLNYVNQENGVIRHFRAGHDRQKSLLSNAIRTLYLESDSILWIGAWDGLSRMNIQKETFTHFTHFPDDVST